MPPLEPNEEVLYTARKHWFIVFGETIFLLVLAFLPGLLLFAPHVIPPELLSTLKNTLQFKGSFFLLILFLWTLELLILCMTFFLLWTDYYLDVWFVTNLRVIAIGQHGMFHRSISTFRLDMIQDATVKVPGVFATLLSFGTVEISTASDDSFKFKGAANPNQLKEKIIEEHHRVQRERQEVYIKPQEASFTENI